jgi:broad specificity phosphatase PhoE
VRARETARLLLEAAGIDAKSVRVRHDERLREKEFGILDRLTVHGIRAKFPELSDQRSHVGKFYFRPPGGESWCDVILRLRSAMEMTTREHGGQRVLVVGHQVIVNCMRYLVECMDEAEILAIDRLADVPNCGVTSYVYDPGKDGLVPDLVNFIAPLREAGTPVTAEKDVNIAAKP